MEHLSKKRRAQPTQRKVRKTVSPSRTKLIFLKYKTHFTFGANWCIYELIIIIGDFAVLTEQPWSYIFNTHKEAWEDPAQGNQTNSALRGDEQRQDG